MNLHTLLKFLKQQVSGSGAIKLLRILGVMLLLLGGLLMASGILFNGIAVGISHGP